MKPIFSWHSATQIRPRRLSAGPTPCQQSSLTSEQMTDSCGEQTLKYMLKKKTKKKGTKMLKYTTNTLFLHLAPWTPTQEKEEIIPDRTEHICYNNTAFLLSKHSISDRLGLGWHTRDRRTQHGLHTRGSSSLQCFPPKSTFSLPIRGACLLHRGPGTVSAFPYKEQNPHM